MALYPPILSSTQIPVPSYDWRNKQGGEQDYSEIAEIFFTMPLMNSPKTVKDGHCQLSIRYKSTGDSALNSEYSPDNSSVYYFNGQNKGAYDENNQIIPETSDTAFLEIVSEEDRIWKLCFNAEKLVQKTGANMGLRPDTEYSIQIRFGENPLPDGLHDFFGTSTNDQGEEIENSTKFAEWWNTQIDDQMIGEWSNTVVLYAYGFYSVTITSTKDAYLDFIPSGKFTYSTEYNDPPARAELQFTYYSNSLGWDGETPKQMTKRIELSGDIANPSNPTDEGTAKSIYNYKIDWNLHIFPFLGTFEGINLSRIDLEFTMTTQRGVVVGTRTEHDLHGYKRYFIENWGGEEHLYFDGKVKNVELKGDELEDGMIAKDFTVPTTISDIDSTGYFKVFRVNVDTCEAIALNGIIKLSDLIDERDNNNELIRKYFICKDYSIEFGEPFVYFAVFYRREDPGNGSRYIASNILYDVPEMKNPPTTNLSSGYYGRLRDMPYNYLCSRDHQLRLAGNVTLNSISLNTQDALQTTIGSKYPYYTRNAAPKYRSMQIGALISIQLDPTATFLTLEESANKDHSRFVWKDGYDTSRQDKFATEETVVDDSDIMMNEEINRSRHRIGEIDKAKIDNLDSRMYKGTDGKYQEYPKNAFNGEIGPLTAFDRHLDKVNFRNYTSERTSDMLFLERRYREKVMEWLTNGKPKLFRSPTEGNIIVVLSAVSFTPFQNSERMVYSFTATATEVAEYNLDNLIAYNLVPTVFESNPVKNLGYDFDQGNEDPVLKQVIGDDTDNEWGTRSKEGEVTSYARKLFR